MIRAIWCSFAIVAAISVGAATCTRASAQSIISGRATVTDGDTVVVNGITIRLKGVDAPERGTVRGEVAHLVMLRIVGGGPLSCALTGEKTWGREVGFCFTADGVDIGQAIIEAGAALACARYSDRYVEFEQPIAIAVQRRARYCLGRSR